MQQQQQLNNTFRRHCLLVHQRDRICQELLQLEKASRKFATSDAARELAFRKLFRKQLIEEKISKMEEECCTLPETMSAPLLPKIRFMSEIMPAVLGQRVARVVCGKEDDKSALEYYTDLTAQGEEDDLPVRDLAARMEDLFAGMREEMRVQRETLNRQTHLLMEAEATAASLRRRVERQSRIIANLVQPRESTRESKDWKTRPKASAPIGRRRRVAGEWEGAFDDDEDMGEYSLSDITGPSSLPSPVSEID